MRITVITATWNSAATVRDTFESVLRQTHPDIDYVVVDGASTDGTVDIIREYEPRFGGRMRWISEKDHGLYDAMNKGLRMAQGEAVGILNSDDFYTAPDILERVSETLTRDGADAVYGDIHFVDDSDLTKCVRYYSSRHFRRWKMRIGYMPAHPSFYCRREVYEKLGPFDTDFKVAADFEQLLRFIFVNRIATRYIARDFVTMRTGGLSTSGLQSWRAIYRDHMKAYKKNGVYSNFFLEMLRYPFKAIELIQGKLGMKG